MKNPPAFKDNTVRRKLIVNDWNQWRVDKAVTDIFCKNVKFCKYISKNLQNIIVNENHNNMLDFSKKKTVFWCIFKRFVLMAVFLNDFCTVQGCKTSYFFSTTV